MTLFVPIFSLFEHFYKKFSLAQLGDCDHSRINTAISIIKSRLSSTSPKKSSLDATYIK